MATNDYSNASSLLRGSIPRGVVDPSSRPIDFIRLLQSKGCFKPASALGGPEPYQFSIVTGNGSTAESFVEGQALPAGSRRTNVTATLNAFYYREVVKTSGRVRDIAGAGGYIEDVMQAEIANGTANLMYVIEQALVGSTTNIGIASIIDSTTLYGGVDPATYTVHACKETGSVGSLTAAKMQDHYEASLGAPYNMSPNVICTTINQIGNYLNIAGLSGGTNVTRLALGASKSLDVGLDFAMASYNGIPMTVIREMTNTEMYWLDLSKWIVAVQRDVTFEPLAKTNDDTVGMVSMALFPVVQHRRAAGSKMEGITA